MKVAYNSCFGGFGLSILATTEFAKKKGITLTWYDQENYNGQLTRIDDLTSLNGFMAYALTIDAGKVIEKLPNDDSNYYPDFDNQESRCDPDLIDVIEKLGEKANGTCADLSIKEIPDGSDFEITEYDGSEDVVPPRMSW